MSNCKTLVFGLYVAAVSLPANADIIDFRVNPGTLGASLDGLSTATNDIAVPGFATLSIDIVSLSSNVVGSTVTLNGLASGTQRFGIDLSSRTSGQGDDTDQFDATFEESVVFRFKEAVTINTLNFVSFDNGDEFEVANQTFTFSDLDNQSSQFIDLTDGSGSTIMLAANETFMLEAKSGSIGLQSIDVTLSAVPEPSSLLIVSVFAISPLFSRKRKGRVSKPSHLE